MRAVGAELHAEWILAAVAPRAAPGPAPGRSANLRGVDLEQGHELVRRTAAVAPRSAGLHATPPGSASITLQNSRQRSSGFLGGKNNMTLECVHVGLAARKKLGGGSRLDRPRIRARRHAVCREGRRTAHATAAGCDGTACEAADRPVLPHKRA